MLTKRIQRINAKGRERERDSNRGEKLVVFMHLIYRYIYNTVFFHFFFLRGWDIKRILAKAKGGVTEVTQKTSFYWLRLLPPWQDAEILILIFVFFFLQTPFQAVGSCCLALRRKGGGEIANGFFFFSSPNPNPPLHLVKFRKIPMSASYLGLISHLLPSVGGMGGGVWREISWAEMNEW